MATLSEEQLRDIADAYSCEQIIDLLDIEENLDKFSLRPVDCNDF